MAELRPELPPMPGYMEGLPITDRGYPVPYFVAWLDADLNPVRRGQGTPDFRVIYPRATLDCHRGGRCWVCGGKLGAHRTFVIGPMCAINRTSAEPPSHLACADWSARACPFLVRPHMRRNEKAKPESEVPAGIMLPRNPGVTLVWTTKGYGVRRDPGGGLLFYVGEPEHVRWYREGRRATRREIEESIESGLPALRELAEQEGSRGLRALDLQIRAAWKLLPTS